MGLWCSPVARQPRVRASLRRRCKRCIPRRRQRQRTSRGCAQRAATPVAVGRGRERHVQPGHGLPDERCGAPGALDSVLGSAAHQLRLPAHLGQRDQLSDPTGSVSGSRGSRDAAAPFVNCSEFAVVLGRRSATLHATQVGFGCMRIFLLALGTRGDFELFLTLSDALKQRGHVVRLGSSRFYASRVAEAGLDFVPIGTGRLEDFVAILRDLEHIADRRQRAREVAQRWLKPQLDQGEREIARIAMVSDYFVGNLRSVIRRGDTVLPTAFVTYDPPSSIDALHHHVETMAQDRVLELVAMSRPLVDPHGEWGQRFHFTGFWRAQTAPSPAQALVAFVRSGAAPVVMTMGSMLSFAAERLLDVFKEALRICGRRAVVVSGWAGMSSAPDEHVFTVTQADYDWLFPQAACIVHHGGSGTVGAALRAGRPSVLLPQISAQEVYGEALVREHLASASLDVDTLTP